MAQRVIARTAAEYGRALVPHLDHQSYRCDSPLGRLMGKGCRDCHLEAVIAIQDFRATGDLAAFEAEMKPHTAKRSKR